jgi:hypothetical protein
MSETHGHRRFTPDPALLVLAVIWGINFPVIKGALEVLSPLVFNALRFPLAAGVLLALMVATGGLALPERRHVAAVLGLGILGNVVYQLFFIHGVAGTSAGNASLLLSTRRPRARSGPASVPRSWAWCFSCWGAPASRSRAHRCVATCSW